MRPRHPLGTRSGSPPPRLTDSSIRDRAAVSPAVANLLLSDRSTRQRDEQTDDSFHFGTVIAPGFRFGDEVILQGGVGCWHHGAGHGEALAGAGAGLGPRQWSRPQALTRLGSAAQACSARTQELLTGGDHRCRAFVNGLDDLGVIDSAQVRGCDGEIGMLDMRVIWQLCQRSGGGPRRPGFSGDSRDAVGA